MKAVTSYVDELARRWFEDFVTKWKKEHGYSEPELREAITTAFPGRISNIVFSDHITPDKTTFLYWSLDQKKARQDLNGEV